MPACRASPRPAPRSRSRARQRPRGRTRPRTHANCALKTLRPNALPPGLTPSRSRAASRPPSGKLKPRQWRPNGPGATACASSPRWPRYSWGCSAVGRWLRRNSPRNRPSRRPVPRKKPRRRARRRRRKPPSGRPKRTREKGGGDQRGNWRNPSSRAFSATPRPPKRSAASTPSERANESASETDTSFAVRDTAERSKNRTSAASPILQRFRAARKALCDDEEPPPAAKKRSGETRGAFGMAARKFTLRRLVRALSAFAAMPINIDSMNPYCEPDAYLTEIDGEDYNNPPPQECCPLQL